MNFCNGHKVNFEWFFPVKGHSYMPADRSFSKCERFIKKRQSIYLSEEYDKILESCGTLFKLGQDCQLRDYSLVANSFLKVKKGFLLSDAKVLGYYSGRTISFKNTYSVHFQSCDMIKRGKQFPTPNPPVISPSNNCTAEKMKDVMNLTQKLGIADLPFYENFKNLPPCAKKVNDEAAKVNEDLL